MRIAGDRADHDFDQGDRDRDPDRDDRREARDRSTAPNCSQTLAMGPFPIVAAGIARQEFPPPTAPVAQLRVGSLAVGPLKELSGG